MYISFLMSQETLIWGLALITCWQAMKQREATLCNTWLLFRKHDGNKHIGGVWYSHTIRPTIHIYNIYHAYQILFDNDNGFVICTCGSYKYQEMRTMHRKMHIVYLSWQEFNWVALLGKTFVLLAHCKVERHETFGRTTLNLEEGTHKWLVWRTLSLVTPSTLATMVVKFRSLIML